MRATLEAKQATAPPAAAPSAAVVHRWESELVAHIERFKRYPAEARARGIDTSLSLRLAPWPDAPLYLTTRDNAPAAAALMLTDRMRVTIALAVIFGVVSAAVGYYVSWVAQLPTGASMVVIASLFLLPGLVKILPRSSV